MTATRSGRRRASATAEGKDRIDTCSLPAPAQNAKFSASQALAGLGDISLADLAKSASAERQRRYRERKRNASRRNVCDQRNAAPVRYTLMEASRTGRSERAIQEDIFCAENIPRLEEL